MRYEDMPEEMREAIAQAIKPLVEFLNSPPGKTLAKAAAQWQETGIAEAEAYANGEEVEEA